MNYQILIEEMADLEAQESKKIYKNEKVFYEVPEFDGKNIPVKEVAKLMGKDQQFIRQGIIRGSLPIGTAFKKKIVDTKWNEEKESSQYDFYISPRLLWEYTGIIYKQKE